jgi:hypothetical protein
VTIHGTNLRPLFEALLDHTVRYVAVSVHESAHRAEEETSIHSIVLKEANQPEFT